MTSSKIFVLLILVSVTICACGPVNFTKVQQEAKTYTVDDDYQVVYARYHEFLNSCQMIGWKVDAILLDNLGYGEIKVRSAHEALYYVRVEDVNGETKVMYNHGFYLNRDDFYLSMEQVGRGDKKCSDF